MKQIKGPRIGIVRPPALQKVNLGHALAKTEEASKNRLNIIEGTLAVEFHINGIIAGHLFRTRDERRAFFCAHILSSDWCSFAAKRKMLIAIVEEKQLLEGKARKGLRSYCGKSCRTEMRLLTAKFRPTARVSGYRILKASRKRPNSPTHILRESRVPWLTDANN